MRALIAIAALAPRTTRAVVIGGSSGRVPGWRALSSLRGGAVVEGEKNKALYALGCNIGRQLGDLGCFDPEELDTVFIGLKDQLTGIEPSVNLPEYLPKAAELFQTRQKQQTEKSKAAGEAALSAAAKEEGAIVTKSGLVMRELVKGEGEAPKPTDTVRVHYTGTLPDGTVFDSSIKRGEPIEFPLDRVVKGWTEGLQLMRPGGKARLTIPAALGYGDDGQGMIPPKSALVFEVELLAVVEKKEPAAEDKTE